MRKYEIMYILDQDTKDVKAVSEKLNSILLANSGKIIESAEWGLKEFSYEIKHKKKGYYFVLIVETTGENINEFQRIAGIDKEVVRTLVINTESEKRYVQTTKLSKTDMTKYREEKKQRNFDRGPRDFNKSGNRYNNDARDRNQATDKKTESVKSESKTEEK